MAGAVKCHHVVNGKVQGFEYFGSCTFFGKALPSVMGTVSIASLIAAKGANGSADTGPPPPASRILLGGDAVPHVG